MARKENGSKTIEKSMNLKFCDYSCEFAESSSNVPGCLAWNPIHCTKYDAEVAKSSVCMDVKYDRR